MSDMSIIEKKELETAEKLNVLAAEIRTLTATALTTIIEIGRRMTVAKGLLEHGEFGNWLKENTGYSQSTAENFMRIFDEYGAEQTSLFGDVEKSQTFGNLTYSKALALLSVPKSEREAFVSENAVSDMSVRELKEAIKARQEAEEALTAEKERAKAAEERADAAEERARELESRPVEVAVQRDEQAIRDAAEQAKEAADAKWKKDVDAAKAALGKKSAEAEKLEKDLAAALDKLKKANDAPKDDGEKEKLRQKIEALERKLKTSDAAATKVKLLLGQFQTAHRALMDAIDNVEDAEAAEKMRQAVKAQIDAWREAE